RHGGRHGVRRRVVALVVATAAVGVGAGGWGCSSSRGSGGGAPPVTGCTAAAAATCPDCAFGYVCAPGADPGTADPSLYCYLLDRIGTEAVFCCDAKQGGPPGSDCTYDPTMTCPEGADGFGCSTVVCGGDPTSVSPDLSCTTGQPVGVDGTGYCCVSGFPADESTCRPDDTLAAACPDPQTFPYRCVRGQDPATLDARFTCAAPSPDPDGFHDDVCCTFDAGAAGADGGPD
ncbi:MAG: hypothetical protein ACRELB_04275, partial [Polyangiaceae bacterium]